VWSPYYPSANVELDDSRPCSTIQKLQSPAKWRVRGTLPCEMPFTYLGPVFAERASPYSVSYFCLALVLCEALFRICLSPERAIEDEGCRVGIMTHSYADYAIKLACLLIYILSSARTCCFKLSARRKAISLYSADGVVSPLIGDVGDYRRKWLVIAEAIDHRYWPCVAGPNVTLPHPIIPIRSK